MFRNVKLVSLECKKSIIVHRFFTSFIVLNTFCDNFPIHFDPLQFSVTTPEHSDKISAKQFPTDM